MTKGVEVNIFRWRVALLLLVLLSSPAIARGGETARGELGEYTRNELARLASDIPMRGSVEAIDGMRGNGNAVDRVARFRVTLAEQGGAPGAFDMVVYLDDAFVASRKGVSLPYDFKWNFKGMKPGPHGVTLVLTDDKGLKGVVRLHVVVQH
jgi:hypothetical protein